MGLTKLLDGVQIASLVCFQWGDSGKGKFSDFFSYHWADVNARGTGGNNAGHTAVVNGEERVFHLVPAGISGDADGKKTILGNGMVIDLEVLSRELDELDEGGASYNNLMISRDANVIMPYHVARDRARHQSQTNGGIGSTGRGIGPCYTDKTARRGVRIADLFDRDTLANKIEKAKEHYPEQEIDVEEVIEGLRPFADRVKPFVRDTVSEMHEFVRKGKRILLEGAQGLLLSIEHGTDPYVTSSDCSLNGTAGGVGLPASAVDLPLGIVKFPFMTRVGAGPFPTELGGQRSEEYCAQEGDRIKELKENGISHEVLDGGRVKYDLKDPKIVEMMNSGDPFVRGVGIRLAAGEYGATTGRPRRVGWTDAVSAKYAVGINGPRMILTKADSIAGAKEFSVCYGYNDQGTETDRFSRDLGLLRRVEPVNKDYEGYGDISEVRNYDGLPGSLKEAVGDFERFTGGNAVAVSVGPDREETIVI